MPLTKAVFAYDTETDRIDPEDPESTYCCLVQICPIDAKSVNDVILYESDDAITDFLQDWESTSHKAEMHCYNLGNYEFEWLRGGLIKNGYRNVEWSKARKIPPHSWRVMYDTAGVFKMDICNSAGYMLTIKDDMKIFDPSLSMATLAASIRMDHPDWWPDETVKEEIDRYNDGWHFFGHDREQFLSYSRLDAYSQAMITRYIMSTGMYNKISAAGFGLAEALSIKYKKAEWINKKNFRQQYPPLSDAMQELAEGSMLAGFVWGEVGTFEGHFTKWDYKSSYPSEYDHGKMFRGKVRRIPYDHKDWDTITQSPMFKRWYLVSFDFELFEGMMPCINAKECNKENHMNLKMRQGRIEKKLYAEEYLDEIAHHYEIDVQYIECWYARAQTGGFSDVIRYNFELKESSPKKSPTYRKAKLNMNGGIHGKTITKTSRKHRIFEEDGEDGDVLWEESLSEQQYCFMIGFTAMQNARCRLLKHCRLLLEAGYHIYMCDTDSLITDASDAEVRRILQDAVINTGDKDMKDILGKFEKEAEFNQFKCWGLKRYVELQDGEYISSAFAGMHDGIQRELLPLWNTDGTLYEWSQLMKYRLQTKHGVTLVDGIKHAGARDVWWHPEYDDGGAMRRLMGMQDKYGDEYVQSYLDDFYRKNGADKDYTEDMVAFLKDIRYDEVDPYWKHHIREAYEAAKLEEGMWFGDN